MTNGKGGADFELVRHLKPTPSYEVYIICILQEIYFL